jgi:hypothetical protein
MFATRKIVSMTAMVGSLLAVTAGSAFAEASVKLECWGNCNSVTVGQVCDTVGVGRQPASIACDDTATPGSGTAVACGGATCVTFGSIVRSDLVGAYCTDGGGNDVIVTCK